MLEEQSKQCPMPRSSTHSSRLGTSKLCLDTAADFGSSMRHEGWFKQLSKKGVTMADVK